MKWLFRFRKVEWPRSVKPATDPAFAAFAKNVTEHFRLCVECDERKALSEIFQLPGNETVGRHVIDEFIKEHSKDEVWSELRRRYLGQ